MRNNVISVQKHVPALFLINCEKFRSVKPSLNLGSIQTLNICNVSIFGTVYTSPCGVMSSVLAIVCWQVCY